LILSRLVTKLKDEGMLMLSDPELPNVVSLVAGAEVKGSWWSHEKGHQIFRQFKELEYHPDVLATRLVSGKVTFLHRKLWSNFLAVATSRDDWQLSGLSPAARRLLLEVDRKGEVRTDKTGKASAYGEAARELERRLLIYSEEIHTEKGSHAKLLMTWTRCPKIRDLRLRLPDPESAKGSLEGVVARLNLKFRAGGRLPWRQEYTRPKTPPKP
jgi:hypothetical protein